MQQEATQSSFKNRSSFTTKPPLPKRSLKLSTKNKFKLSTPSIKTSSNSTANLPLPPNKVPPKKPVTINRSQEHHESPSKRKSESYSYSHSNSMHNHRKIDRKRSSLKSKGTNTGIEQIGTFSINRSKNMTPKQINAETTTTMNEQSISKLNKKKERKSYHKHTKKSVSSSKPIKLKKSSIPLPPPPSFQPTEPTITEEQENDDYDEPEPLPSCNPVLNQNQKSNSNSSTSSRYDPSPSFHAPEPSPAQHQPIIGAAPRTVRFAMDDHKENLNDIDNEQSDSISMPELLEPDDPIPDDLQMPGDTDDIPELPEKMNSFTRSSIY